MRSDIAKCALYVMLLSTWLFSSDSLATVKTPLPADKAFMLSVSFNRQNEVIADLRIAPGYYLYRQRVQMKVPPASLAGVQFPQGDFKYDNVHGRYEAYTGNISIPLTLKVDAHATLQPAIPLNIEYQGCSEEGFCYPPVQKQFMLNTVNQTVIPSQPMASAPANTSFHSLLTDQNSVRDIFNSQHFGVMLLVFAGLGLLLAFTPCVWPMVPILTGIIVGQKQSVTTKKAFLLSLVYVTGSAVTYAAAGLVAASMGRSLQVWLQTPWIIAGVSGLFVLLAFSLFGFYELRLPGRWQYQMTDWSNRQQGGRYASVFVMGMISALIVSPCVTAPLVGVLMYIGQTGDRLLGASALFAMGLGMGMPLLLIGLSAGKWLPKSGPWMEAVKKMVGLLMLGMAIWLLSRIVSPMMITLLWGGLLLCVALFLGAYLPRLIGRHRFNRSLGFIVGLFGLVVIAGGVSHLDIKGQRAQHTFVVVTDINEFNKQVLLAHAANKRVILDFYADWCASCVTMDKNVFDTHEVQKGLNNYVLLRADLTANNPDDQALLRHFNVIAPPTVLFFGTDGREKNAQRIVGEVDAKEFLTRLDETQNKAALQK